MSGAHPAGSDGSYAKAAHYRLMLTDHPITVVLLHGLGADLTQPWDYTCGHVGGRLATRLAPDARLHGETHLRQAGLLNFDVLAADVVDLVDQLGLSRRLVLVGVSMGAGTALRVAQRVPERIHGLVLIRPAWLDQSLPPNLAVLGEVAALLKAHGANAGRALFAASPAYRAIAEISPSGAASVLGQFDKPLAVERVQRLEDMPRSVPYPGPAAVREVTAETLVIGAQGDPMHPMAIAQEWARLIPTATLTEVVSRDLAPDQQRTEIRERVDNFLASLPPS